MKSELIPITLAAMAVGPIADPAQAGDTMPAEKAREENAYTLGVRLISGDSLPDIEDRPAIAKGDTHEKFP